MIRFLLYISTACMVAILACRNNPTSANTVTEVSQPDTVVSVPDAADLLQTLQGKWQSERDTSYMIEIAGDKMKHYNAGQMSVESTIEIDASCLGNACKIDSTKLLDGWCFIEKGQYDAQCNLILKCDKRVFQYQAIGAANDTLRFSKK